ncbi:hypothetical protein [Halorhabdus amylolytica]|uniref:hypothetical protein n=1 Tax=Halorhabdus amylolytica TaxID=2559573 RepID=UPI0010AAE8FD|nr:hypothetical protein [Halorhabdus amylolytica]
MKKAILFIIVVLAILISGCVYSDTGNDDRIAFDWNITEDPDGEYRISGFLYSKSWDQNNTIHELRVLLYDENREIIFEQSQDRYHTEDNKYMNISVNEKPKYIVFTSPSIWESDDILVEYYVLTAEGHYATKVVSDPESLPVNLPAE